MAGGSPQIDRAAERSRESVSRLFGVVSRTGFLRRRIDLWTQSPAGGSTSHRSSLREGLRKRNVDTHPQMLALIDRNFSEGIDAPNAKLPWPVDANYRLPKFTTSVRVFGSLQVRSESSLTVVTSALRGAQPPRASATGRRSVIDKSAACPECSLIWHGFLCATLPRIRASSATLQV
jgi:hypothetical protein